MSPKHLISAFLVSASLALAQPQAPIDWSPARLLMSAPEDSGGQDVYAKGDTIALLGYFYDSSGGEYYPTICITGDNGLTWSPWHILGQLGDPYHFDKAQVIFAANGILCSAETNDGRFGLYRSTDLGLSWQDPLSDLPFLWSYSTRNDTIFGSFDWDSTTWTGDEGATFTGRRDCGFSGAYYVPIRDLSVSANSVHAVTTGSSQDVQQLAYTRAPLYSGAFDSVRHLQDDIAWTTTAYVTFADDGTGVILTQVNYVGMGGLLGAIAIHVSHDDGATWSSTDTLTPYCSADYGYEGIEHWSHRWFAFWVDSTRRDCNRGGVWGCFSANNCRNWYPPSQIECSTWGGTWGGAVCADVAENGIRVYVICDRWQQQWGDYYIQVEGQIHPDTLLPVITPIELPPDTVPVAAQLLFLATVADNDTLSAERLRVRSNSDTMTIAMTWTGGDYMAYWTVPEEGRYWYRIEGEDFWENIGSYPDSGWAMLVTPGWIDEADPFILPPSSFILSVFPNPANGPVSLSLSPDWLRHGPIEISVFNLLGETVWRSQVRSASGTIRLAQDHLASGIYLLHVSNVHHSALQKLLILK